MGPRRSHRKSRNGCPECKARRLKCDERYPCTNCVKHAPPCSYAATKERDASTRSEYSQSPTAQSLPADLSHAPSPLQSQTQSAVSEMNDVRQSMGDNSQPENGLDALDLLDHSTPVPSGPNKEDWALDLELMHHYCSVTCNTLAIREDARHIWRVVVPIEGYSNAYVMHGILALSAIHRAYLYPLQKDRYIKASAYHLASGLKEFRELIVSPITPSNWQPVFCFASMISIHTLPLPARLGVSQWPAPISNIVEMFSVIQGFQSIMKPFISSLTKTQLAPLVHCVWVENDMSLPSPSSTRQSLLPPDTWRQITRLHQFVDDYPLDTHQNQYSSETDQDHRKDYKTAVEFLELSAREIELAGPHLEVGMILLWAYPLSKRFRHDLQTHQPAALVLLAHWCVLLRLVDHYWFVNGAARQLLDDIEDKMHPDFREWLVWPRRWVLEI